MATLGMVFTVGVSLEQWEKQGLLDREKLIYEKHLRDGHFEKIIWFTYGRNDSKIHKQLIKNECLDKRIEVVSMPKFFRGKYKSLIYSYLIPFLHWKKCKELDVVKTNQMGGAWTAAIIHNIYNIPFLLRTGYTYSSFFRKELCYEVSKCKRIKLKWKVLKYTKIERAMYHKCNLATVSSLHDKEYVINKYNVDRKKVIVIGNYIDCNKFRNNFEPDRKDRFIFVGRLCKQKNLYNTIKGVADSGYGLDIYGTGELEKELQMYIEKNHYDVRFMGTVENDKLPEVLNKYKYYILASEYEGMPKTLLEAMACGAICVGTDVEGINEVIKDGYNGVMAKDISVKAIHEAIAKAQNLAIQKNIYNNIKEISKMISLESIVNSEWKIIQQME